MKQKITTTVQLCFIFSMFFIVSGLSAKPDNNTITETSENLIPISVRLPWIINNESAGMFVAQKMGYYKEEGLKVDIKPGGLGIDPVQLVASGEDTFGVIDSVSLINAVSHDIPIVGLAATFQRTALGIVTIDPKIKKMEDLKDKRIGRQPVQEFIVEIMLSSANLSLMDVKGVSIGFDLAPLIEGKVDAQIAYISDQTVRLSKIGKKPYFLAGYENGYNFYGNVIITKKQLINKNEDIIIKFLRATSKGWIEACNKPEMAIKILLDINNDLERESQLEGLNILCNLAFPNNQKSSENWGKMDNEFWKKSIELLRRVRKIDKPITVNELIKQVNY